MFIVSLENGETLIEGKHVENWDSVPKNEKIISVSLTSGGGIYKTLSGFEEYAVMYDGKFVVEQNLDGITSSGSQKVCSQSCYGKKDVSRWLKAIDDISKSLKIELNKEINKSSSILKDKLSQLYKEIDEKSEELKKKIRKNSFKRIYISIEEESLSPEEISLRNDVFRKGIADSSILPNNAEIKKYLIG